MANKTLFSNTPASRVKPTDYVNAAGGKAYEFTAEHSLCQYVVTGTFNNVFYATAGEQLEKVKALTDKVRPELIAKAAVYGHELGKMKDVPAYLLAVLSARGEIDLLRKAFPRVITNVKMLLNFVQIVRSNVTGRRSFGTAVKKLIQDWFKNRPDKSVFISSIGHANPSLGDVIKMVHPSPDSPSRAALYGYLLGRKYDADVLPEVVLDFEAFKADNSRQLPDVPFMALSNFKLSTKQWKEIGRKMPWNTLRMNINTLHRNGTFEDKAFVKEVAAKLADANEVRKNSVFPYQLMTTYQNITAAPQAIRNALHDALEVATENVPKLGEVAVAIDISGSMNSPATGYREGATSVTTCRDVAALMGACILRKNPESYVFGWDTSIHNVKINPKDSVLTNAANLRLPGGGTDASVALKHLNAKKWKGDMVVYVSDNQSWYNSSGYNWHRGTTTAAEWEIFRKRNPKAKLVCIDIQPYGDTQVPDGLNVLNIGGFSDAVFNAIGSFNKDGNTNFVQTVESLNF